MASIICFGIDEKDNAQIIQNLKKLKGFQDVEYLCFPQTNEQKWSKDLVNYIISLDSSNIKRNIILRDLKNLWTLKVYDKILKTIEESKNLNFIFVAESQIKIPETIKSRSMVY